MLESSFISILASSNLDFRGELETHGRLLTSFTCNGVAKHVKVPKMDENDHYENITYMLDENVTIYM
jgi:hypothetical protein